MAKREDSGYIKTLSRANKEVLTWAKVPLIVQEKGNNIAEAARNKAAQALDIVQNGGKLSDYMLPDCEIFPVNEFVFMDKTINVNDPKSRGVVPHNYFHVLYDPLDSASITLTYATVNKGIYRIEVVAGADDLEIYENDTKLTHDTSERSTAIRLFLVSLIIGLISFFIEIEKSGLYAVETKGKQHRKVHEKKPWQRSDLVTIQYLNAMPKPASEPKGGTHASPRYHQRRATKRKLTNKRYKNHPKYGGYIHVKSAWVGKKEAEVDGITYKVL